MRWKLKDNCRHQYRSAGPVSDLVYRYIENLPGNQKNQTHGTLKFERKNKQFQITGNEARGGQDNFKNFQKTEFDEFQLFTRGIKINYTANVNYFIHEILCCVTLLVRLEE